MDLRRYRTSRCSLKFGKVLKALLQVFPIRLGTLDPRILLSHIWRDSALARLKSAIPVNETEAVAAGLQVEEVLPREKDGGAFARVTYATPNTDATQRFEEWLKERLDRTLPSIKPWWLIGSSKVHLVKVSQTLFSPLTLGNKGCRANHG